MEHTEYVDLGRFETYIHYHFKDKHLLLEALSHSSYANEKRKTRKCNERLEFLGDSVLSIVVSEFLFHKYPELPEGELTKLRASMVCEKASHVFAKEIHLGEFLSLGKGEEHTGGRSRSSILADAFEAVIAAIFLDGGMDAAKRHILRFIPDDPEEEKSDPPVSTITRPSSRKWYRRTRRKRWNMCWSASTARITTRRSKSKSA